MLSNFAKSILSLFLESLALRNLALLGFLSSSFLSGNVIFFFLQQDFLSFFVEFFYRFKVVVGSTVPLDVDPHGLKHLINIIADKNLEKLGLLLLEELGEGEHGFLVQGILLEQAQFICGVIDVHLLDESVIFPLVSSRSALESGSFGSPFDHLLGGTK